MSQTSPTSSTAATPTASIHSHGTPSYFTPPSHRPGGMTSSSSSSSSSSSLLSRFRDFTASVSHSQFVAHSISILVASGAVLVAVDHFFPRYSPLFYFRYLCNSIPSGELNFKEHQVYLYVLSHGKEGDPQSVLAALDSFGREKAFLMNIGDKKGKVLKDEVLKCQPKVVVEIGGYCGYSAILIASSLPEGSHLYTIEKNPLFAAIATKLIEFAGLSSKVTVLIGTVETRLPTLMNRYKVAKIDLLFIDHRKELYVPDFEKVEQSGLIQSGSVVVADNILFPGCPEYAAYIRNNPNYTSTFFEGFLEYSEVVRDGVEVSVRL